MTARSARHWPDRGVGQSSALPLGAFTPRALVSQAVTNLPSKDRPRSQTPLLPIAVSKMSHFSLNQDSLSLVSLRSFIHRCVGHLLRAGLPVRCAGAERGVLGAAPTPPGHLHSLKRKAAPMAACPKPRWPLFLDRLPGQCVGQVPAPCLVTSDADVTVCWGRREVTSPGPDRKPAQCWEGGAPRLVAQQPPQPAEWESRGTTGSQQHASWADGPRHGMGMAAGPTCSAETPKSGFGGSWPWAAGQLSFWMPVATEWRVGATGDGSW